MESKIFWQIYMRREVLEIFVNHNISQLPDRVATDPSFQEYKEAELLSKLERWPESNKLHKKLSRKE